MGRNRREADRLFDELEVEFGKLALAKNGISISKKARAGAIRSARELNITVEELIESDLRPALASTVDHMNLLYRLAHPDAPANDRT